MNKTKKEIIQELESLKIQMVSDLNEKQEEIEELQKKLEIAQKEQEKNVETIADLHRTIGELTMRIRELMNIRTMGLLKKIKLLIGIW